jgi:hypothetical protein
MLGGATTVGGCAETGQTTSTPQTATATSVSEPTTTSTIATTTTTLATTTTLSHEELRALLDQSYRPLKGIYLTSYTASNPEALNNLIEIADQTEINAFVIDIKDSSGYIAYDSDAPAAANLGFINPQIKDIDALIATLVEHDITPIARLVCFQDSALAKARPNLAVKSEKTGDNWLGSHGVMYMNPYSREVWEYLVEVAEDAAKHGFREIQFDYVRFPSDGPVSDAVYPGADSSMEDAIAGFLAFARARLEKLGVWVSADVFGITVQAQDDSGIGQQFEKMAANVDVICPMIYPSHYAKGAYGLANPNADPYGLISAALTDTTARLAGTGAKGRPWLQDFTLGSPAYGVEQVKAELKAAEDQGFDEWILWNVSNTYTVAALGPD